jgi:hypothetical protein
MDYSFHVHDPVTSILKPAGLLLKQCWNIVTANNEKNSFDLIRKVAFSFRILFVDIDGFASDSLVEGFISELRRTGNGVIICCTNNMSYVQSALRGGADLLWMKPLPEPIEIASRLQRLCFTKML